MEQLCEDAISQATLALLQEGAPRVGTAGPAPAAGPAPTAGASAAPPRPARAPRGFALGPIPPGADLQPAARAAADHAVAAWQAARFDAALAAFSEAARLQNDPQFLFDQAVCEQRLARNAEALAHTQQFIARAPASPYRPYADQLMGELAEE
jgi:tetratricopeptide (TPR) repeat protein